MIALLTVLIEHRNPQLSRPFTYRYDGQGNIRRGIRVEVDFHQQVLIGFVLEMTWVEANDERLSPKDYEVVPIRNIIDDEPILTDELIALAQYLSTVQPTPMISFLQTMVPKSLRPSKAGLNGPKIAYEQRYVVQPIPNIETTLSPVEYETYQRILTSGSIKKGQLKPASIVKSLLSKQAIILLTVEKRRTKFGTLTSTVKPSLTLAQSRVVDQLWLETKSVNLLHGVTGSGKTEIYLALCERVLSLGKSVLIIVPEIALTPIMMSYLFDRFGEDVALLHSELTPSEKYDEYRRIVQKKARIVVGARSAIFAPLTNLGLIVVDEEHSETYKQDSPPSYHARDIAIWRGDFHQAKVLLGSATPSLESKARAEKHVYGHYKLDFRVNEKASPKTTIINLNQTELLVPEASMFTLPLLDKIKLVLARNEQVILLVNRRGYATSLVCRQCNHTIRCPDCEIPLAYHHHHKLLKCHYCDYRAYAPSTCPDCGQHDLMYRGFGIEKVEEHLIKLFPNKKIIRMDSDTASIREHMLKDLKTFQEGKADILLGTQMVAKGHDFPNVTLVGVLLADMGLNVPSYRSAERTFQLLSQVVGRTGRGDKDGEAIIQTYHPEHYVIQTGSAQDYATFYREEMMARKATQYPPYTFLTLLEIASSDEVLLTETVMNLYTYLQEKIPHSDHLIGPNIPYPEKQGPFYRRRILLKYKNKDAMIALTQDVFSILQGKRNIRFHFNIDPYVI